MKKILYIASSNSHKVREFSEMFARENLDVELRSCADVPAWVAPEENGKTFRENAFIKADALFKCVPKGSYVFADDSGLVVDALGGAPGIMSARYAGGHGEKADAENNAKLLRELEKVPDAERSARFVCVVALITPDAWRESFEATFEGFINRGGVGVNGFGYDPLFFLPEFNLTSAELFPERKNSISHRGKAFAALIDFLKNAED